MTLATVISLTDFGVLVDGAFKPESPVVASSESELGEPLERFLSSDEIKAKASWCATVGLHNYSFGLWYPSLKGRVIDRRIDLDPPRDGKTFRYSLSGWGLIHLQLYFTQQNAIQCRVVVNSEARAKAREGRYPELGPASEWNWRGVETCGFWLTRSLAAMGPTAPVVQPMVPEETSASLRRPDPWRRSLPK